MAKLVSLVWYKVLPALYGGQKGIAGFNEHLGRKLDLTCLCSRNNELAANLSYQLIPTLPESRWQFLNPFTWLSIKRVIKREATDFLILEHPYHGLATMLVKKTRNAKLILHSHNIESERFRLLGKRWWRLLRGYEGWVHRNASICLFKTVEDRDWAISNYRIDADKCLLVPYGVERPVMQNRARDLIRKRHGIREEERILLFAGTLDYLPNAEALQDICRELLRRLRGATQPVRIIVCGRDQSGQAKTSCPELVLAGEVTDIENYFQSADCFINPVLKTAGIQTKNIEAMAHGCPVVCFDRASTGIPAEICADKLLTVEDGNWDKFVVMIQRSLNLPSTPTTDAFFDYFGWDRIIAPLLERIQQTTINPRSNG